MPTFRLTTFGCAMNESDSERVEGMLETAGYTVTDTDEEADLLLYNTCSVRQKAEDRVFGMVPYWQELKRKNPQLIIGLTGCMVAHGKYDFSQKMPEVDFTFKIAELPQLPIRLARLASVGSQDPSVGCAGPYSDNGETPINDLSYFSIRPKLTTTYQATVPIMAGCDKFCTYCIVPFTRGRENSRNPDDIISEVHQFVAGGAKEILLTGQNVNSFIWSRSQQSGLRVDIARKLLREKSITEDDLIRFAELLRMVGENSELKRIRFTSPHPQDMTTDVIKAVRDLPNACEHIHLPVQSGSNRVLKLMNRTYTRERFMEIIEEIRTLIPSAAITTDTIVGFPGETEEDFEETIDLYRRAKFDMAFIAQYSPRPGTVASDRMNNDVFPEEKKRRFTELNSVLEKTSFENNQRYEGKQVEILVEKIKNGTGTGRTRTSKPVEFKTQTRVNPGDLVEAKITRAREWLLEGEV